MNQIEKDRLSKSELTQRNLTFDLHLVQIIQMMKRSEIVDPVGVILDITGTYGRQTQKALYVSNGMSDADAEKKIDEMIAYYDGEGRFPALLMIWTWGKAEDLMPRTSPTGAESLRKLKWAIEPGQAAVIVVGRHGNSYAVVDLNQ